MYGIKHNDEGTNALGTTPHGVSLELRFHFTLILFNLDFFLRWVHSLLLESFEHNLNTQSAHVGASHPVFNFTIENALCSSFDAWNRCITFRCL